MKLQSGFKALADPTRRQILMHLSQREMTIAELASQFDMTRGGVKKHLTVLEEGALISVHASGRERINRLAPEGLKSVTDWLNAFNRFWDQKLDNLQTAVTRAHQDQGDNNG